MSKVKRISAKSLAKEHKKMMSTQNSERFVKGAPDLGGYEGTLR